jgi:hypothetical protein
MIQEEQTRFRLAIPVGDAFAFAMGWSDLGSESPSDTMRQVIGLFVLDCLEYSEQWRVAAQARASLADKWPDCF